MPVSTEKLPGLVSGSETPACKHLVSKLSVGGQSARDWTLYCRHAYCLRDWIPSPYLLLPCLTGLTVVLHHTVQLHQNGVVALALSVRGPGKLHKSRRCRRVLLPSFEVGFFAERRTSGNFIAFVLCEAGFRLELLWLRTVFIKRSEFIKLLFTLKSKVCPLTSPT